ncbi:MAG: PH domain-containing protein [Bacteroidales bacterium]|nr:PH domain-containing protein [Bacteroidales bacterium]
MKFKCVWSKLVTSITIGVLVLIGFVFYKFGTSDNSIFFYISFFVLIGSFAFTPLYVEVTEDSLIIKRVLGALIIPRKDIRAIHPYPKRPALRKFGSGGFFGYLGWFSNSEVGNYFSYSTDENNQIMIITPKRKYVISCENREELLRKFIQ